MENEKDMMPIANEGSPSKLAMGPAKKGNLMMRFYSEMEMHGEWGEE
jgi:hypothetical protein